MRNLDIPGIIDRLLFTAIVIGVLMAVLAGWRYFDAANQLSANQAAQIHDEGGEVTVESKSQAHGLMASDLERRRLLADQSNMLMVGGAGLALIGRWPVIAPSGRRQHQAQRRGLQIPVLRGTERGRGSDIRFATCAMQHLQCESEFLAFISIRGDKTSFDGTSEETPHGITPWQ